MCVVIGRGGEEAESTTEENRLLSERPLRDAKTRLAVFRDIAQTCGKGGDQWPLWLPPALRALVGFEITRPKRATGTSDNDTSPERFVVSGFIESMCNALQNLEAYSGPSCLAADDRAIVDYDIPLSLHDARIFLVAVGRLSPTERSKNLSKLVTAIRKLIKAITEDESDLETLCGDYEVASLVARIVTVCSYMVLMVEYPPLQSRLNDLVRHGQSPEMPGFISENDWYRPERCFMGLFSDWESARVPLETPGALNITGAVAVDMAEILNDCFSLGFKAAKADRGQLLFAAWNATGNQPLWDSRRGGDRSQITTVENLLSSFDDKMQEGNDMDIDFPEILRHIR